MGKHGDRFVFNKPNGVQFDYCERCYNERAPHDDPEEMNKFPDLPDLSLPKLSLPKIKMPDMPDISMPDVSAPDLSAPDFKKPKCKDPRKERWGSGPWGRFQMHQSKVSFKGSSFTLENSAWIRIWKGETEDKGKKTKHIFKVENAEEAESWANSMVWGGAEMK